MLSTLQTKLDDAIHREIKNSSYATHLNMIDGLIKQIQQDYPDFSPDELVTKLSDIAERESEQQATMMLGFKKEVTGAVKQALDSYKQIKVAA